MPGKQRPPIEQPLTAGQMRFCERYVEHGNATKAFREAGLTAKTPTAARRAASWLLSKRGIQRYVDELRWTVMDSAQRAFTEKLRKDFGH